MEKLMIGEVIYRLRKERKLTQEQLANFIGVSIAAVSKWEKGNSYPDIVLLPKLATFFQITIDQLLNHNIQLTEEETMEIYSRCEAKFNDGTEYEDAIYGVKKALEQYPQCYLLKFRLANLLWMYAWKATDEQLGEEGVKEAIKEFEDIANNSKENQLVEGSWFQLGALYSMNKEFEKAIDALEQIPKSHVNPDDLLASVYLMQGRGEEARRLMQGQLFQSIQRTSLACFALAGAYKKDGEDIEQGKRYIDLGIKIKEAVNQSTTEDPGYSLYNEYYQLAELAIQQGHVEESLSMLQQTEHQLSLGDINSLDQLKGMWCFDAIEFSEVQSTANLYENLWMLLKQECFAPLREEEQFKKLLAHIGEKCQISG